MMEEPRRGEEIKEEHGETRRARRKEREGERGNTKPRYLSNELQEGRRNNTTS